jgi:hypothetical protein
MRDHLPLKDLQTAKMIDLLSIRAGESLQELFQLHPL